MTVFSLFLARKMPWLFVVWLVLAVLGPHQELYKIFFHAIVIPAILILLINKETHIDWSDPLLKVALLYFVYGAVTTFIVGSGPIENHFRALRWCLEIVFCLLAFFIWMPALLRRPLWWGRLLVLLAGLSSLFASALFFVEGNLLGRLSGPGGLHNPIQTGAVLLVFLAVGVFILSRYSEHLTFWDKTLMTLSFMSVFLAVVMTKSRAPIGAMLIYSFYLAVLRMINHPKFKEVVLALFVVIGACGILLSLYGTDGLTQQLLARGMSYRLEIWQGYLESLSGSWWFGVGLGTDPQYLPAAETFWKPNNIPIGHPHSVYIGTLVETGIIGSMFLLALVVLLLKNIVRASLPTEEKFWLLGLIGLVFMLTMTGSQGIISSIKMIWLFLWMPVIFIWLWCRKGSEIAAQERSSQ